MRRTRSAPVWRGVQFPRSGCRSVLLFRFATALPPRGVNPMNTSVPSLFMYSHVKPDRYAKSEFGRRLKLSTLDPSAWRTQMSVWPFWNIM
ncbi:hypothetical protein OPQ81_006237 [Rhizoctonia solani]|nr:hypothetical protein OPQ81_006237 [Rhizoctonia solani]